MDKLPCVPYEDPFERFEKFLQSDPRYTELVNEEAGGPVTIIEAVNEYDQACIGERLTGTLPGMEV